MNPRPTNPNQAPTQELACISDPELFFETSATEVTAAKLLCSTCVELDNCKVRSLLPMYLQPESGTMAGKTVEERIVLRRSSKQGLRKKLN